MHRQDVNSGIEHDRILLAALQAMSSCASSSSAYSSVSDALQTLFINKDHVENSEEIMNGSNSVETDNIDCHRDEN